ncbi:MAG TPA: nitrogenase [Candidatus Margulisbacteria bacterium]|nr:MAG: nitrogenase [Candidatus Margulisbacteria bacterium GWE2_39_32]HCT83613.1 nitrogenase [Candidatus Margulisiibacteriota bacterium]
MEATINSCKLCAPLGASLAYLGMEGTIPLLHGSQGCATYIRRYLISHFREPVDIASSNFSESTAVFGGQSNLLTALANLKRQYNPELIGIASTCLSETIGDDVAGYLNGFDEVPTVNVSTPSYQGGHEPAFWKTGAKVLEKFAQKNTTIEQINLFPGMVSTEDIRYLKEIFFEMGIKAVLFPDYSERLDGESWSSHQKLPKGGTTVEEIRGSGSSELSVEFCTVWQDTPGNALSSACEVTNMRMALPIGINLTDAFFNTLKRPVPEKYLSERGRLVDAYMDNHKYIFEKKAILYGDQELVIGLASFLSEIGIIPVVVASGSKSGNLEEQIRSVISFGQDQVMVKEGIDFDQLTRLAEQFKPDLLIGSSKGYHIARELQVPLIRVGFPIHDRIGGQRTLHLGYRGTQALFDRIVNAILEKNQELSPVGYSYM